VNQEKLQQVVDGMQQIAESDHNPDHTHSKIHAIAVAIGEIAKGLLDGFLQAEVGKR
jgi:hypothetical protein